MGRKRLSSLFANLHATCYNVNMRHKRAYRYRCYPTPAQAAVLARTFGGVRYVYNWALRLRTDAYYQRQERVGYADTSAALTALTALKREPETAWLNEVSRACYELTITGTARWSKRQAKAMKCSPARTEGRRS